MTITGSCPENLTKRTKEEDKREMGSQERSWLFL